MSYNGYANYETWNVNLWIDNDEGSADYWRDAARDAWDATDEDDDAATRSHQARVALADRLRDEHRNGMPEETGVYADLLGAALDSVDWFDVANVQLTNALEGDDDAPYVCRDAP